MGQVFSFSCKALRRDDPLPPREDVSTVFLVGWVDSDHIIAIRNERGWDLPGGHMQENENFLDALNREVAEEADATFKDAAPFVVLSSDTYTKLVIGFVSRSCQLQSDYEPMDDALERKVCSKAEMIDKYFGDKKLIQDIGICGSGCLNNYHQPLAALS